MPSITRYVRVKSGPGRVWDVLNNLETVPHWYPPAQQVELLSETTGGMGARRRVHGENLLWLEQVVMWNEGQRLALMLENPAGLVAWQTTEWAITSAQMGTGVMLTLNIGLRWSFIGWLGYRFGLRKAYEETAVTLLAGLKQYVESNRPATAAHIAKLHNQVTELENA
ncbi:MAG: SRPBCC family protein [Chloroflexota bacterium]|jgi:hypothetical protein